MDAENTSLFVEVDSLDSWQLLCLLDVAAMGTNRQAHQVMCHLELLVKQRLRKLPSALPIQHSILSNRFHSDCLVLTKGRAVI